MGYHASAGRSACCGESEGMGRKFDRKKFHARKSERGIASSKCAERALALVGLRTANSGPDQRQKVWSCPASVVCSGENCLTEVGRLVRTCALILEVTKWRSALLPCNFKTAFRYRSGIT